MQTNSQSDTERAAFMALYRTQLLRGQMPSVYLPRPSNSNNFAKISNTANTANTLQQDSLCSTCQKPLDRDSLPGYFNLVGMKCLHSFCSQCCLKLAGKLTCPTPGCNEPIPAFTQQSMTTQLRYWAVDQAVKYCEDESYKPLLWHCGPRGFDAVYDKAAAFLQSAASPSSQTSGSSNAFIDIDSLRPHLMGLTNLTINVWYAEALIHDLDSDPTDKAREKRWIKTVLAVDNFLSQQGRHRKQCQTSMLREYLELNVNSTFPAADAEDAKLLFDFVVHLCEKEGKKRSWRTKSASAMSRVASRVSTLRGG
ncbi:hypothetical protein M409DRAFT_52821 [Zasmidium cellare ATCC 36951]|uniref:RING-type domain-containing protein n=1 Tax=Zasmidium cellare ATCC 36951 TaxID=1080233 RepID=A0A6A6CTK7_ZASCE|nr:uncharacterized protein M409DRAFT_52821 [Zasmidium cellare ATCC 36951]KAF2168816.1 hypothetical protein M409DRAFT_52821 [Zasmidium cellare ATCC 36951]